MPPSKTDMDHWNIDRRIPMALVITLVIQTGGMVWWASSLNSQVEYNNRVNESQAQSIQELTITATSNDRVNVRLIEQIEGLREATNELKRAQIDTNVILRDMMKQRN